MPTFTASRFSPDNGLYPDRIEIDAANVVYYKGNAFGYTSTVIARSNIASVYIGSGILFADVVIESYGSRRVTASGFKKSDARMIVGLLT